MREILNKKGPVVIIDDDEDDLNFLKLAFEKLNYPNEALFFSDAEAAFDYLVASTEQPFLILSDINMPKMDGFALRNKVQANAALAVKCIPFLFFSTAAGHHVVTKAYSHSVQGYFIKPTSLDELELIIEGIMEYWHRCVAPNNFPNK